MIETMVALAITAVLIGVPTWLITRAYKKVDGNTTVYSPEEVTRRLRKGFFMSNWGIELAFGAVLSFALMLCNISIVLQFAVPIASVIIGFVLLFAGSTQVGLMTRYLNNCNRDRTELEEWVLNAMQKVEISARERNGINAITRLTPGVTDDMLAAINSNATISGFMSVGQVYTGKNILRNHWPFICIALMILAAVLKTVAAS